MNAIDRWDGVTYQRVVPFGGKPVLITVAQRGKTLNVTATGSLTFALTRQSVTNIVERLLGIRVDLSEFYEFASIHAHLDDLATRFRGMKPPRFATVFEGLVNGISCQQLSLTVGIILLNRLAELCGLAFRPGIHAFPRPQDIAGLYPSDLRKIGYSGSKARALLDLAQSAVTGKIDLEGLVCLDNAQCVRRLVAIKGVGRWTAEYTLLRALGRTDVFPGDDVGARNSLVRWLHLRNKLDYERVQKILRRWKGYGGLIFLHLLLNGLDEAEKLGPTTSQFCIQGTD